MFQAEAFGWVLTWVPSPICLGSVSRSPKVARHKSPTDPRSAPKKRRLCPWNGEPIGCRPTGRGKRGRHSSHPSGFLAKGRSGVRGGELIPNGKAYRASPIRPSNRTSAPSCPLRSCWGSRIKAKSFARTAIPQIPNILIPDRLDVGKLKTDRWMGTL